MSIVAYYVQVSLEQLQLLRQKPVLLWQMKNDARFAKAAMLDVDQDWQVISWLASPKKRLEQQDYVARMHVLDREERGAKKTDKEAFKKAVEQEMRKMGNQPQDTDAMPTDPLLKGIEGRCDKAQRDTAINFGLGGPCVYAPTEVKAIADAFALVKESAIKAQFNRATMAKYDVGGMSWKEEKDSVYEDFLLPSYRAVSQFYQSAAKAQNYVLVIYN